MAKHMVLTYLHFTTLEFPLIHLSFGSPAASRACSGRPRWPQSGALPRPPSARSSCSRRCQSFQVCPQRCWEMAELCRKLGENSARKSLSVGQDHSIFHWWMFMIHGTSYNYKKWMFMGFVIQLITGGPHMVVDLVPMKNGDCIADSEITRDRRVSQKNEAPMLIWRKLKVQNAELEVEKRGSKNLCLFRTNAFEARFSKPQKVENILIHTSWAPRVIS